VIGTSLVLAKAIKKAGYDLVISGMASTDAGMGVVRALLAERLGVLPTSIGRRRGMRGPCAGRPPTTASGPRCCATRSARSKN
jgi:hypothetical protein